MFSNYQRFSLFWMWINKNKFLCEHNTEAPDQITINSWLEATSIKIVMSIIKHREQKKETFVLINE